MLLQIYLSGGEIGSDAYASLKIAYQIYHSKQEKEKKESKLFYPHIFVLP